MQRVASFFVTPRGLLSRAAAPLVASALGASLLLTPIAHAQDATPAATPEASQVTTSASAQDPATISELFSYELAEFPTAPVSVRLLRITLQPGASSPMHTHPGPEFDLVESGTLTANIDGTAIVGIGGESSEVTGEQSLGIGQWIMYPC